MRRSDRHARGGLQDECQASRGHGSSEVLGVSGGARPEAGRLPGRRTRPHVGNARAKDGLNRRGSQRDAGGGSLPRTIGGPTVGPTGKGGRQEEASLTWTRPGLSPSSVSV
jgi:hypothetical protein